GSVSVWTCRELLVKTQHSAPSVSRGTGLPRVRRRWSRSVRSDGRWCVAAGATHLRPRGGDAAAERRCCYGAPSQAREGARLPDEGRARHEIRLSNAISALWTPLIMTRGPYHARRNSSRYFKNVK